MDRDWTRIPNGGFQADEVLPDFGFATHLQGHFPDSGSDTETGQKGGGSDRIDGLFCSMGGVFAVYHSLETLTVEITRKHKKSHRLIV